jgi:hypothetical protein
VSISLLLECDPIDQPAAVDPIERLTWCALRIRVGQRFASRIWDKTLQSERTNLYLPAFPIAEWIVQNWWSLLNELCSSDAVPKSAVGLTQTKWLKRHCLRAADSSLMLPALYLFHDGQNLRAEWQSDAQGSMPNMPGEFIADGAEQVDSNATQESLAQFISMVLGRVAEVNDARVQQITEQWRAIQGADGEERDFCTLAGRMGIDPYDRDDLTEEVSTFLEATITNAEDPLVRDLTELARPDSVVKQWSWLSQVGTELNLGPNPVELSFDLPLRGLSPPQFGYGLARLARAAAGVSPISPLESVESVVQAVAGRRLRFEERNHVPGHGILAIVGQSENDQDIVAAGPRPSREDNHRFLNARSLYHALVTTQASPRLVTGAFSWDQKASRAFAAELLAPQQALAGRVSASGADSSTVESLSSEFNASPLVIEKQLENAGIPLSCE